MRLGLVYGCLSKGLAMTLLLIACHHDNFVVLMGASALLGLLPSRSRLFQGVCGLLFPCMEVIIIRMSRGNTWTYTKPDLLNVPLYIFPLWAVVAECVADLADLCAGIKNTPE